MTPASAGPQTIRVLAVDDHPILMEGIAAILQRHPDIALVGTASNGRAAVELHRRLCPDVTLMDLQMPELNGIDAIKAIRDEFPSARILVLTTYSGDVQALRAIQAGAAGYLLKGKVRKELVDTIRAVYRGQRRIPSEIAADIAEHVSDDALTPRETEVLSEVAAGFSNKSVAERLGIADETVKIHMKRILSKLSARDRTQAVMIAVKRGIITP